MTDNKESALAKNVYDLLCTAIENRDWTYTKRTETLSVQFTVNGDDIPMNFIVAIDEERQLIRLMSPLPFKFTEEYRLEGAIATNQITYALTDGSFDYNMDDGSVIFRVTTSFRDSLISDELFQFLISFSCFVVDKYNDTLLGVSKGTIKIDDFINSI